MQNKKKKKEEEEITLKGTKSQNPTESEIPQRKRISI
jgi:hypothetical protein